MKPSEGNIATRDVTVTRRMRDAGGLFLGKTNMPEAGYWAAPTAACTVPPQPVATGLGPIAEGSDGAGSVRIPAAACGVYGFKPSVGRIPQEFLAGRHQTWLAHGPFTRTVADAALAMEVLSGPDASDLLSVPHTGGRFLDDLEIDISGWRVAWSPDLGLAGTIDPEVVAVCERAVRAFEELGAIVVGATPRWHGLEETMWESVWLPAYGMAGDALDWDAMHGQVDARLIAIIQE